MLTENILHLSICYELRLQLSGLSVEMLDPLVVNYAQLFSMFYKFNYSYS